MKQKRNHCDNELEHMSKKMKKIRLEIESCQHNETRKILEKERKVIKSNMRKKIKQIEEQNLESKLYEIEKLKDDSTRCFAAIRDMKNNKKQKPLIVKNENGKVTSSEEEQTKIIADHFKKMLAPESQKGNFKKYKPIKMNQPFTKDEIKNATKSMKNGKSAGTDDIHIEFIKYAPAEIHEEIANIFNRVAETEEEIKELVIGLLRPIQKPGKEKGPPANLRPIILLSALRKILTICILKRIWTRIEKHIPIEQAAYQPGRSTTEQVFAVKTLIEKAIISNDYKLNLLLLDMSKAFDTVDRMKLFDELEEILEDDEIHILSKLTNQPEIKVKIHNKVSNSFITNTGIMQGDCLSAILFILYLAKCLKKPLKIKMKGFSIQPKFADDLTFLGTSKVQIDEIEKKLPNILKEYNLEVNLTKTEKYEIPRPQPTPPPPTEEALLKHKEEKICWSALDWIANYKSKAEENKEPNWKECKLLGSKLGTQSDIQRRKGLTIDSIRSYNEIFKSRKISLQLKIRTFDAFCGSIFLYNSELWTLTETLIKQIDSFHRRLLRRVVDIRWPKKITNENLYEKTKVEPWSRKIKRRRLNWIGHLMRLNKQTPARIALSESLKPNKKVGRPPNTWLKVIEKDLATVDINIDVYKDPAEKTLKTLEEITTDRKKWKKIVKDIMAENS